MTRAGTRSAHSTAPAVKVLVVKKTPESALPLNAPTKPCNPYSEAHFKTLKYAPVFPGSFGSLADARAFSERFFGYYNHEHRHAGIGLHTPASVHHGTARDVRALRQQTLNAAYAARPERFGHRRPEPPKLPTEAWINQPSREALIQSA